MCLKAAQGGDQRGVRCRQPGEGVGGKSMGLPNDRSSSKGVWLLGGAVGRGTG